MNPGKLTPGKEYKFRVRAVNSEGESENLETDKNTHAKNPYDEPKAPGAPTIADWDNVSEICFHCYFYNTTIFKQQCSLILFGNILLTLRVSTFFYKICKMCRRLLEMSLGHSFEANPKFFITPCNC